MKPSLFLAFILLLVSCATAQNNPEDKIIGRWRGIGIMQEMLWVFEKDHTFRGGEDTGKWSYQDGKFLLGDNMAFVFNAKGQIVLIDTGDPDEQEESRLILQRESDKKPEGVTAPTTQTLAGEWRFAYTKNSMFMLAPVFDIIRFMDQGKVQTTSTLVTKQMEGNYAISGDDLKLTALGPAHVTNNLTCRLEDHGKMLVLSPKTIAGSIMSGSMMADWVHLRPDQFLPNEIAGTYIEKIPGERLSREMELRADGRLRIVVLDEQGKTVKVINGNKNFDFYRLWRSPFGKAMTTVFVNPDLGLQSNTMKYERKNDELIITPITCGMDGEMKLMEQGQEIWKLKQ